MIRRAGLAALIVVLTPALARAHPLGNFTINLYAGVRVAPGRVIVEYVVDMAEDPTYQARYQIDDNGDGSVSSAELAEWAARRAPALADGLSLTANGRPVLLDVTCSSAYFRPGQTKETPTLRFQAAFVGRLPFSGRVSVADTNFSDRVGWREITAAAAGRAAIESSTVPQTSVSDELLSYPRDLLSSPLRTTSATFSFRSDPGEPAPPAPTTCRRFGGASARPLLGDSGFARLVDRSGVPVMGLALLLAVGFGAWHALLPGHGKTLMAAYMVGAGSRLRQAVAIGIAVALMHTSSVLALGLLVLTLERTVRPDLLYPWLGFGSGIVAIGLGTTLLIARLGAWSESRPRADHDHEGGVGPGAHGHRHGPGGHVHTPAQTTMLTRKGLTALAVAGGILPAPTALIVLLAAIEAHRVAFGLTLIAAFSAGLAAALIVIGVAALRARESVAARLSTFWARLIPVASAVAIVGVGLFLAVRGVTQVRL
jgi:ABC-type nickel/cobalt efflux system permease component RcnA